MGASGPSVDPNENKVAGCLHSSEIHFEVHNMLEIHLFFFSFFFSSGKTDATWQDGSSLGMLEDSLYLKWRQKDNMQNFYFDELTLGGNNTLHSLPSQSKTINAAYTEAKK